MIGAALDRLAAAGVAFALRGEQPVDAPPHGGDVDVLVACADADAAERVLKAAGFNRLEALGRRGHRFYLALDGADSRWLKIDLNLVPASLGWDLSARDARQLERFASYRVGEKAARGLLERALSAALQRAPLGLRRRGPVVAVLGPDGAGKGSVIAELRRRIPASVRAVYLGDGESRAEYRRRPSAPGREGAARQRVRSLIGLLPDPARMAQHQLRRAARATLRAWAVYPYAWRGDIVLCDRHPLEGLADDPDADHTRELERAILRRLVPWPDAVLLLDASGEVLFRRKGEHSPDELERSRQNYRRLLQHTGATVVPADGTLDQTVEQASAAVWHALARRRSW